MNTIIAHYHYRVDNFFGKVIFTVLWTPHDFPDCVAQLDKYWLPNCDPSTLPIYDRVEKCYYNKIFGNCNDWVIMEF